MKLAKFNEVFDYRTLRLLMGIIAFSLPFMVYIISSERLSSISACYYTESRDIFVGMLFIIGVLMWAYNGHSPKEFLVSKIAAIASLTVAIFPASIGDEINCVTIIHYIAALILFLIIAYFCYVPFRMNIKEEEGKKGIRSKIYFACGSIILACISIMIIWKVIKMTLFKEISGSLSVMFWAETVALMAFGFAWIVAGKCIPLFVDEEDRLKFFM